MLRAEITGGLLSEYEDIASAECVEEYFNRLFFNKQHTIDSNSIADNDYSAGIQNTDCIAFRKYAEDFEYIRDETVAVVIDNCGESRELLEQIYERPRYARRKLQRYSVGLKYHSEFAPMLQTGRIKEYCKGIYVLNDNSDYDSEVGLLIDRYNDKIKFPWGLATGCVLVGMKEPAFESYGKTQSFNSAISETAMKKYTSAFNYLLSDRSHRVMVGGMVVVFFAIKNDESDDSAECDLFAGFFGDTRAAAESKIEAGLSGALKNLPNGSVGDTEAVVKSSADENATFYVAGLSANSSRICQKFIYRSRFGDIEANLNRHTEGLKMCGNKKPVSFYALEQQLKPPKSKDYVVPPPLMTGIILAALKGTRYPDALLQGMIRRVLTDSDGENEHFTKLNDIRAGVIKACINRKYGKEELTVALDVNNNNEAYLCGRLFAVLEKIQQDASKGTLNRTITDAYFSSAASKPSSVLPKLIQLSMNHQRKLSDQSVIYYNKLIGGIIDGLNGEFPQTLDLDGQGRFIVGYYQQKQAFYTKKTDDGKEG